LHTLQAKLSNNPQVNPQGFNPAPLDHFLGPKIKAQALFRPLPIIYCMYEPPSKNKAPEALIASVHPIHGSL